MKLITPLIVLLLIACANAHEQVVVETNNSLAQTKADSLKIKIFAEISRTAKDSLLMQKNKMLDTLLKYVDIYKDSTDRLADVERSLQKIHNKNTVVIDSLRVIKAENVIVKLENRKIKHLYAISNVEVHSAKAENENLKKKFSMPTVAGVDIKCYGFKTRFLKAPQQYETSTAKDIKRIVIRFIIPANELIEKKTYVFSIKISGILNKSIVIRLSGEEVNSEPLLFDILDLLKAGEHIATIDCNGTQVHTSTLRLN